MRFFEENIWNKYEIKKLLHTWEYEGGKNENMDDLEPDRDLVSGLVISIAGFNPGSPVVPMVMSNPVLKINTFPSASHVVNSH